jgi:hypothetical protein
MRQKRCTVFAHIILLSLFILGVAFSASVQGQATGMKYQADQGRQAIEDRATETQPSANRHGQIIEGQAPEMQDQAEQVLKTSAPAPALSAALVQREQKAKAREATVQVQVAGVEMVDPASADEKPQQGQAHLHYQLDSGPIIATTATKLSFHKLSPGKHQITVVLSGNDHNPLGPKETLQVTVPGR